MHTSEPLRGKTILLASSASKLDSLTGGLLSSGATVLAFPVIEIRGVQDTSPLDRALSTLDTYDWILFTSVHGVQYFFRRLHARNVDTSILGGLKFCVIGPATANALRENGFEADLIPERFLAEGVVEALERHVGGLRNLSGRRILMPRARVARDVLPRALREAGAQVTIAVCYETVKAGVRRRDIRAVMEAAPDLIVFTSASTVRNTVEIFGPDQGRQLLQKSTIAAIGPVTAGAVKLFGKEVEIIPKESTIDSLIQAIKEHYSRRQPSASR